MEKGEVNEHFGSKIIHIVSRDTFRWESVISIFSHILNGFAFNDLLANS